MLVSYHYLNFVRRFIEGEVGSFHFDFHYIYLKKNEPYLDFGIQTYTWNYIHILRILSFHIHLNK